LIDDRRIYACFGEKLIAAEVESRHPSISCATRRTREMNRFVFDLAWAQSLPLQAGGHDAAVSPRRDLSLPLAVNH
jgi:hypothetical protein